MYYAKLYGLMLIGFLAIDLLWLGVVARRFYQQQIGFLLREQPNWGAALAFYALFVGGILVFVVSPSLQVDSSKRALLLGGFFGLVTYATYDLTNLATMKNWPWPITAVDLAWGAVLSAAVGWLGYTAGKWLA